MYEISKVIGEGLVAIGKSPDAEPSSFSREEIDKYLVSYKSDIVCTNSFEPFVIGRHYVL